MIRLFDTEKKEFVDVPNVEAKSLINSKKYGIDPNAVFDVYSKQTRASMQLSGNDLLEAITHPEIDFKSDETVKDEEIEKEYGSFLGETAATGIGALSTASFGASDYALTKLGVSPETLKNFKEVNPEAYTFGEMLGLISPTSRIPTRVVSSGVKALANAGKLGAIGTKIAQTAEKAPTLANMFKMGSKGAVDLYAFEAGRAISEAVIEDKPLTVEEVLVNPIEAMPYGFAIGQIEALAKPAIKKIYNSENFKAARDSVTNAISDHLIRYSGKDVYEKVLSSLLTKRGMKNLVDDVTNSQAFTKEWAEKNLPKGLAKEFLSRNEGTFVGNAFKKEHVANTISTLFERTPESATTKDIVESIENVSSPFDNAKLKTRTPKNKVIIPRKLEKSYEIVAAKAALAKDFVGREIGELSRKLGNLYDELSSIAPEYKPDEGTLFGNEKFNVLDELNKRFSKKLSAKGKKVLNSELGKYFEEDKLGLLIDKDAEIERRALEKFNAYGGGSLEGKKRESLFNKFLEIEKKLIDKELEELASKNPSYNDLYELRSTLSEYSKKLELPKDRKTFYEMADYLDTTSSILFDKQLERVLGKLSEGVSKYKNPESLVGFIQKENFPSSVEGIIQNSRINGKLDKKLLRENFLKIFDANDLMVNLYNKRLNYYSLEKAHDVLADISDLSMHKNFSIKDWKNSVHLALGLFKAPLGLASFALDMALDSPKVKLTILEALMKAEKNASKEAGNFAYNMFKTLKDKTMPYVKKELSYPFLDKAFKESLEEVENKKLVDSESISDIIDQNGVLSQEMPEIFSNYLETYNRSIEFIKSKAPNAQYDLNGKPGEVSDLEKRRFMNYYNAVKNPEKSFKRIISQQATPQEIEAIKAVYPAKFLAFRDAFMHLLSEVDLSKLTNEQKTYLSGLFGIPFTNTILHTNLMILQNNFNQLNQQQQQQAQQTARPRKLPVTQYKGMLNRNSTSLQKTNSRQ